MKDVSFIIWNYGNMCRIETSHIGKTFCNMCDGGCIMDLETMLQEMERITEECKKIGYTAKFETMNVK